MRLPRNEQGVSLIETMIAVLVAFIAMSSIGAVVFTAMASNQSQGVEQSRMTSAAQERMEQLLRLDFNDTMTNTTLVSDSGWQVGLTSNSTTDLDVLTACPSSTGSTADIGYADFLDSQGNALAGTCATVLPASYFQRRWKIVDTGTTGLKQITVVVLSPHAVKAGGAIPMVALTSFKTQ